MVLTLLSVLIAGLVLLALFARLVPGTVQTGAVATIAAAVVVLAGVALRSGASAIALPIGPAGAVTHLALDPLSACFLLLLFLAALGTQIAPLTLAGTAATLLAADGFGIVVGLLLLGGQRQLRLSAVAAVCIVVALALFGSAGEFAVLRTMPPDGWRAAVVLLLVLAAAGCLIPLDPAIAAWVMLRVVFDLCGSEQAVWWGVPLLLAGAGFAAYSAWRAALADTLHAVAGAAALLPFGVATMALGVALCGRAVDLPSVASLALAAAWLGVLAHVLCRTLLQLVADEVERSGGTRRLDLLGGVIRGMPVTASSCLSGLFAFALLPPGIGFAAFWLLFQSLLAMARFGDPGLRALTLCVALLLAASFGLATLAGVRLFGIVFLGRPRSPRGAVAEDPRGAPRHVLAGFAALTALLGILPGLALLPAAGWTRAASPMLLLTLRNGAEAPGYSPIFIAAMLAMAGLAARRALRVRREPPREPVWNGGFAALPPWLPFGDPAAQFGAASFVAPLRKLATLLPRIDMQSSLHQMRAAVQRATTAWMAR